MEDGLPWPNFEARKTLFLPEASVRCFLGCLCQKTRRIPTASRNRGPRPTIRRQETVCAARNCAEHQAGHWLGGRLKKKKLSFQNRKIAMLRHHDDLITRSLTDCGDFALLAYIIITLVTLTSPWIMTDLITRFGKPFRNGWLIIANSILYHSEIKYYLGNIKETTLRSCCD